MDRLKGKVALVTGGATGIGKAIALRLAQDGASVVIADLQKYDEAAAAIAKATGCKTLGARTDVSSESDVSALASQTMKAFGRLDILVNNAAGFSSLELRPFEEIPPEEFRRVMEVNILGVWLCCRECVPHMKRRIVPCTSITRSGELPATWCSSSIFWVMSACSLPLFSSSTRAR